MEKKEILEEIENLKRQIEELKGQFIDLDLPKNYDAMTEEEKKTYHKKQDKLKKEALSDMSNYSVVNDDYTIVSYPKNKNIVNRFMREVGEFSSIPLERDTFNRVVPEKYKQLHKQNLSDIDKLIERYNSTKAIRNDRVEFGANFENFIQLYFSPYACKNLMSQANKEFLKTYDRQLDKNGNIIGDKFQFQNLTDDQRKDLIKIRIKLFSEKLNKLQSVAAKKVASNSIQKQKTYLEKYGFLNNQTPYRNGAKKFTTVKSVVSKSGVDMAKIKLRKTKLKSNKTIDEKSKAEKSKSRLIELNVMREKFDKFIKFYKGNGRQFSIEFEQNFPEIAEKIYKQKTGDVLSFRSQNLSSSPISVQQHEIEKQFDEEFRKVNFRLRYSSYYIPASNSACMGFLGKNLTNAKTQTEKNLDQMKVKDYERELKTIKLREDLISYETIFESLNNTIKKDFSNYITTDVKNFNKLSEKSKKNELKKFLVDQIERLKEKVHKNKFFSLGTEKLERLGGILISQDERVMSKEMKSVFSSMSAEEAEKYKFLVQSVKDYTSKYNHEKQSIDKLSQKLEKLSQNPFNYEISKQIQSTTNEINARNKKLVVIKSSLDNAMKRKSAFENNFAARQIDKAITSDTSKAIAHNTATSVFDKYAFPAVDAFGDKFFIEKNSIEGKQVERVVANFIMNFKNQLQNLNATFSALSYQEITDFALKMQEKNEDDFGSTIRDLKKTQKFLKAHLEKVDENDSTLKNELEIFTQRLAKIESDLIKKLKSMNVEIGDVTLVKSKK